MTLPYLRMAAWTLPILASSLCAPAVSGQTQLDLQSQTKNVDFSKARSTRPFPVGDVLPATCRVGETWFKSNAPDGQNLYLCTATNVWTVTQSFDGTPPYGMLKSLRVGSNMTMTCSDGQVPTNGECALALDTTSVMKPDGNNMLSGITSFPATPTQNLSSSSVILCNATRIAVRATQPLTLTAAPLIADPVRDGQLCIVQNVGSNDITLTSGVSQNLKLSASTIVLKAGHPLTLIWDQATSLWTQQQADGATGSGPSISYGAAQDLGTATAEGVASTVARSDHVHKRTVQVANNSVVSGTRGRINLMQGSNIVINTTDDAANDEIDVTITALNGTPALASLTDTAVMNPQNNECLIYAAAVSKWRNVPCPQSGISSVTGTPGGGVIATTDSGVVQLALDTAVAMENGTNAFSGTNSFPATATQTLDGPSAAIDCNATRVAIAANTPLTITAVPTIIDASRDGELCMLQNTGANDIILTSGAAQNLKLVNSTVKIPAGMFLPLVWDQATSLWTQQAGEATGEATGEAISFGSAADLGDATSDGTSNAVARADHTHKRTVQVAKNGTIAGTRSRINLGEGTGIGISASDDSLNDEIDLVFTHKAAATLNSTAPVCPSIESEISSLTIPALGVGGMARVTLMMGKTVAINGHIVRVRTGNASGQLIAALSMGTTELSGRIAIEIHQQTATAITTFGFSVRENNGVAPVFTPSGSSATNGANHPLVAQDANNPLVLSITGRLCAGSESMFVRNAVVEVVKAQ